ncbi:MULTISPECIES: winged helix-turn-helix transcriptional regulator [Streptomyces]|uniref:winged helix-turn-helix transcriptional regulator n=1 Tax=Streptomyces TaxID=1883 RepID=UPI0027E59709|nr:winged helix-turn-helix transcriptional regulator [Streptomyces lateritius]
MVEQHAYAQSPPRVEYALTALGRTLPGPIEALGRRPADYGDAFTLTQGWNTEDQDIRG